MSQFGKKDKETFVKYYNKMLVLINKLTQSGKINSNHVEEMKGLHEILRYVNSTFSSINNLDLVTRDPQKRSLFLSTIREFSFDAKTIDDLWWITTVNACLRYYWIIESSLLILLKYVKYDDEKDKNVKGDENLGRLKNTVFKKLGICDYFFWNDVDISFRNALAHGWFLVKDNRFTYYQNSQLKNPRQIGQNDFIIKVRIIYLMSMAISGSIGKWETLDELI